MPHRSPRPVPWPRRLVIAGVGGLLILSLLMGDASFGSDLRNTAIVRAVRDAGPSVVNIQGEKTVDEFDPLAGPAAARRVNGMGTGVVIDERGYVVTNYHVVQGVRQIHVTLAEGQTTTARLVAHDPVTDLAVIRLEGERSLPIIKIGTSSDLMPGEPVIAVGNAFGYQHTVTRGIISALHRSVQVNDSQKYEDLIQTDASINPGNSGGPLLNIDGEMIGINVAVRAGAQGIGFAIPVDQVMTIAADLLSTRRIDGTWHGIVARADREQDGLRVEGIDADSPAATSGLKTGDRITSVGEQPLARTLDLERALLGRVAGDSVKLNILRDDESLDLDLVISKLPRGIAKSDDPNWAVLGLRLKPVPREQFRRVSAKYHGGLIVTGVRPDGPAAEQGIRSGDVLVGMHIWRTETLENVSYILNRPDFGDLAPLKFYIIRGNETYTGNLAVSISR